MSRTIINGNGWYLFGVANDETIQSDISNPASGARTVGASCLDEYIVTNHSAKVELAYVVQKHNPIRAWITGLNKGGETLTANTNLIQRNSGIGALTYNWFYDGRPIYTTSNTPATLLTGADYSIDGPHYYNNGTDEQTLNSVISADNLGKLSVTISNGDGDKVSTVLKEVVIYGSSKNATASSDAQDTWTGELNGVLNAATTNESLTTFQWYRKEPDDEIFDNSENAIQDDDGDSRLIGTGNSYTITGDDASKTIYVLAGASEAAVTTGATSDTAYEIYENIGAAHDPFERSNWQNIIYPESSDGAGDGVSTWENETNSTLGVWVKVVEFFDTVAPTIDGDIVTMDHDENVVNQYIDITFTKPLILQHVNVSDFKVTINDSRTDSRTHATANKISDQMDFYSGTIDVTPMLVQTKNGDGNGNYSNNNISGNNVLRLTLPKYDGDGNDDTVTTATRNDNTTDSSIYPYIFDNDGVTVSYSRSGGGTGTILKDTSAYDGRKNDAGDAHGAVNLTDSATYYGGRDNIVGNLVEDFSKSVDTNKNNSEFDNRAPHFSMAMVKSDGIFIDVIFDTEIFSYGYFAKTTTTAITDEFEIYDKTAITDTSSIADVIADLTAADSNEKVKGKIVEADQLVGTVGDIEYFAETRTTNTTSKFKIYNKTPLTGDNLTAATTLIPGLQANSDNTKVTYTSIITADSEIGMPATDDFAITYKDRRSNTQKGSDGISWTNINDEGLDADDENLTQPIRRVVSIYKYPHGDYPNRNIRLKLNEYIYKDHTNAKHTVDISYVKPTINPLTDVSKFKNKVNNFTKNNISNGSQLNNTYPTIITSGHGWSSNSPNPSANTETNKDTNLITLEVNGPQRELNTTDWTLIETNSSGTALTTGNDNFYISASSDDDDTTIRENNNSIQIKIKHKPNFSYTADDDDDDDDTTTMLSGWDITTDGLTAKTYYFKVEFSVSGVDSNTGNTVGTLTTTTPVISLTVSSSTVKTERTRALIRANTEVSKGNMVLFFDKYNGDVAHGPFNGLTSSKNVNTGTDDDDGLVSMSAEFSSLLTGHINPNIIAKTNNNYFQSSKWNTIIRDGGGSQEFVLNSTMFAGDKTVIFFHRGSTTPLFKPYLTTTGTNQGKLAGAAGGNFGWYESRTESPFLVVDAKFRMFALQTSKIPDDLTILELRLTSSLISINSSILESYKTVENNGHGLTHSAINI